MSMKMLMEFKFTFRSKHFGKLFAIIFTIAICIPIQAQNDLQFYLNSAFKNNPTLKENQNLIRASQIDKKLSIAEVSNPKIFLTSNYLFTPYLNNDGRLVSSEPNPEAIGYDAGITNGGLYSALINVEKNIFTADITNAYEEHADIKIKSNAHATEVIRHNITKEVTQLYLETYQSQRLYELSKSIADTILKQLKITEELVKRGIVKQSDLMLLKIEVENERLSAEQFGNSFKTNLSELNSLCGLADKVENILSDVNLKYSELMSSSNYFKQFEYDSLLVNSQQKIFETKYLPQVNLFFNSGLNAIELDGIQRKFGLSAGLNFSMSIYDGNQKSLTRQQSQISLNTISGYKENQLVTIQNKKNDAKKQLEFSRRNSLAICEQVKNYHQVLKLAEAELLSGQRSVIEYIILIRNYMELKKNKVSAEVSYQLAINQYNYWNW